MKIGTCALLLIGTIIGSSGGLSAATSFASSSPAPLARGCKLTSQGYVHSYAKCMRVPRHGHFSIRVPGTHVVLEGVGTPSTAGTEIGVTRVPQPCPSLHGVGIRVAATGKFPPLKLKKGHPKKGKLSRFVPATGACVPVQAVETPGIYEVASSGA